ncbi:hypothetical protein [Pyxidicoccus xibeiensis]|uniref:hypothetical protein n=1 Tax=Pyxidicoccus xibeiensis TaxID=2906759 RepID=UPI0020A7D030|nr:hypothetical protein [Pyxidicoccus xibeiensis]MCP3142170.1 hypothetical protein [Pyxidicoccus xibeiensis]
MSRSSVLLATALLCACGTSTSLPAPDILSVSPNQVIVPRELPAEKRDSVEVSLDAVIPVHVDYGEERVRTAAAKVWIGPEEASVEDLKTDGTLTVSVPEALDEGAYEVRVVLADGREARRPSALTLRLPEGTPLIDPPDAGLDSELTDGGSSPGRDGGSRGATLVEGDITGFTVNLNDLQQDANGAGTYLLIVNALGPRAAEFQGTVKLSINKQYATVTPDTLGPFSNGRGVKEITVEAKGGNLKLTVTDEFGAQGTSAGFKL